MLTRSMIVLFALVSLSLNAHGHAGATLESIDVIDSNEALGIEANFGLLWATDRKNFTWLCHEAITAPKAIITPNYTYNTDDVFLVAVPALQQVREKNEPVYRSTDGCD